MSKRRITLNLDDDVVEALQSVGGSSMSAVANQALRDALERKAHQIALLEWLDELDAEHGAATADQRAAAEAFLDSVGHGEFDSAGAA